MSALEKIGNTELSTYGLRLARIDGHLDMPPYKNILTEHDMSVKMRVSQERTVRVRLIGVYSSPATLGSNIELFKTKVRSAPKQTWYFGNHDFSQPCVVADVMSVSVYARRAVEINLTLIVTA